MGDSIDRKTAIETVRKCAVKEVTPAYMLIDKAEVMTDLMLLPSVQPERKKGKWIDGYKRQTCSVCKQRGYRSWNFCPNCGADMRGEKDEPEE